MATYRRLDLLPAAIDALCRQSARVDPAATILVIDNDPDAAAASEVSRWADRGVRYVHEPEPGISAARNRALLESQEADAVVFIDDDELPVGEWLKNLVECWLRWECAAVVGPVESEVVGPVDPWILAIGIYARRRRSTGAVVRGAATNNLLLDMQYLRRHGLTFDTRFGLSGGGDTMLTHSISKHGGQIRWCDEAVVKEVVAPHRISRSWVRFRLVRAGNGWARVQILLSDGGLRRFVVRATLVARAAALAARGGVRFVRGRLGADLGMQCRGERDVLSAAGVALSCVGVARYEYRRGGRRRVSGRQR